MKKKITIGTRASKLDLWQANWVKSELEKKHKGLAVSLEKIKTTGDKILDVPLAKVGGKVVIDKDARSVIPLLPLDALKRGVAAAKELIA
jgi:hydroxymethylbilane synthase